MDEGLIVHEALRTVAEDAEADHRLRGDVDFVGDEAEEACEAEEEG